MAMMNRRVALAGLVCLATGLGLAAGEEPKGQATITLRAGGRFESQLSFQAEVLDYTGRGLRVRMPSGQERSYPPEEVLTVVTERSAAHEDGDALLRAGEYQEALSRYRQALEQETAPERAWVRREILAQMVRALRATNELVQAGETFLALYLSDPSTFHFRVVPLGWLSAETGERLRRRAQEWLRRVDDPVGRLMGSSYLLGTQHRAAALEALQTELQRHADPRIRCLAQAQVWRTRVPTATRREVEEWRRTIERMPEGLRGGPYYVLGQGYAHLGDPQQAALAYLWLALVYDDDPELAAQATVEAARALERMGQVAEAQGLYQEVLKRFPRAAAAEEARRTLEDPAGPASGEKKPPITGS